MTDREYARDVCVACGGERQIRRPFDHQYDHRSFIGGHCLVCGVPEAEWGYDHEPTFDPCPCVERDAARAVITDLTAERDENEGAFRVWRRRCNEAEAELEAAREAVESTIGLAVYLKAHQAPGHEGRGARDVAERLLGSLQKTSRALSGATEPAAGAEREPAFEDCPTAAEDRRRG